MSDQFDTDLPSDEEAAKSSDEAAEHVAREAEERETDPHAPYRTVDPEQGPTPSIA